jgi:hypothetical protein
MSDTTTPGQVDCCSGTHMREEYYGWRCTVCDAFYPFGCEPWAPLDEEDEDDA